jgi:hypothetical protein
MSITNPHHPTNMIPFDAVTGSENVAGGTSELFLYWLPCPIDNLAKRNVGIDSASKMTTKIRREWNKNECAVIGGTIENNGCWSESRYSVAEGVAIKVWASRDIYQQPAGRAALILLFSKSAPVNVVSFDTCKLPTSSRARITLTGQFWCLNRDTVLDYPTIPPLDLGEQKFASPVFINEVFSIHEAIPAPQKTVAEVTKSKVVATDQPVKAAGTKVVGDVRIVVSKTRRRIG